MAYWTGTENADRLRAMSDEDDGELDEGLLDNVQQVDERLILPVNLTAGGGPA